jgi:hypothetical protein
VTHIKRFFLATLAMATSPSSAGEVQDYVRDFADQSQRFSQVVALTTLDQAKIKVKFSYMDSWIHGVCSGDSEGTIEVQLNTGEWEKFDSTERKILVFHELGHCILRRDHNDQLGSIDGAKRPISLMHSTVVHSLAQSAFEANQDKYMQELFALTPSQPFMAFIKESWVGMELFAAYDFWRGMLNRWLPS